MGNKEEAKKLAKRAIEVANKKLDQLKDQDEHTDANTCIDLIEVNLKAWAQEEEQDRESA